MIIDRNQFSDDRAMVQFLKAKAKELHHRNGVHYVIAVDDACDPAVIHVIWEHKTHLLGVVQNIIYSTREQENYVHV